MSNELESFIDDEFLKQLEKLKIISRKSTRNPRRGEYRSWQSGEGFEFLDFRKYHLGDDLRYVDWSVYGRLDKLFVKLFHAEKGQTAHILLDISRSMDSGKPSKDITAKKIAPIARANPNCHPRILAVRTTGFGHLVADVLGWFPSDSMYQAEAPARLLDTRDGTGVRQGLVGATEVLRLDLADRNVGAVVVNVNPGTKSEKLGFIVNDCTACALVVAPKFRKAKIMLMVR